MAGAPSARGPVPRSTKPAKALAQPISAETLSEFDAHGWELYHVAEDVAENHNVAEENRDERSS